MTHCQTGPGDHLFLIDASGFIYRAFHVHSRLTRLSDGHPIGAVHGFCGMLWNLLQGPIVEARATHVAAVFDYSGRTFRSEIFPDYKAHRNGPPDDLRPQFGLIREAVEAFGVARVEAQGYEADDVIATYARQAAELGARVTIVSADKDLMQLLHEDGAEMLCPNNKKTPRAEGEEETPRYVRVGRNEVIEKFGVAPELLCDVLALAGDSTDNIPGVRGIGEKTAAALVSRWGDLEGVLAHAGDVTRPAQRQALIDFADDARMSLKLVTLDQHVPDIPHIDDLMTSPFDQMACLQFLDRMELRQVADRVGALR